MNTKKNRSACLQALWPDRGGDQNNREWLMMGEQLSNERECGKGEEF